MFRSLLTGRFSGASKARKCSLKRRLFLQLLTGAAFASFSIQSANAQSYTSTSATGLWNSSRWNNTSDAAPYTSAWVANSNASFTSGTYNFSGGNSSGSVNVGNITLASGVTVNFTAASGTIATSATRTIDVGSGSLLDFNTQAMSTAAGTGFIKNGAGVLATQGGAYSGGFTLNAGTVIARGVDAMGANASNVLTLNGGVVASNATRSFANTKFGGGIVIGGNVQFGELVTVVSLASSTANLSFANNVSLGSAVRTFTQGNNGTQTFSGIISNTSGGITFAANASTDGRFDFTNTANTFTGDVNINGGEVRFTADGSLGNAANDIIIDGGRFGIASGATVTLGAGRQIFVGDGIGTGISAPGTTGVLTYNGVIANKSGEIGSWAKQGQGRLSLGGASTYTGDTAINNGTLQLTDGNDRLPTGTVVSLGQASSTNVGTFDLNSRSQQIAGLNTIIGTGTAANTVTSIGGATLTLGGSGSYSYGSSSAANNGTITGAITLTKTGSGTQTLGQSNSYTGGTNVTGGTLSFANGALGTTGSINVNGGALQWNGTNTQDISSRLVLQNSGSATLDTNGNNVTLASGFGGSTSSSLTKVGAGILTMSGTNTYTGGTTVNGGTLSVTGSGSLAAQSFNVASGATLSSTSLLALSGTSTINGNVAATGGLSLGSTAILNGTGTITGATTINGVLAPGNSIGTINNVGDVTWNGGGANWVFEIGAGNQSDLLNITGNFNKGTPGTFTFDFVGVDVLGTYKLVDWTGGTMFAAGDFSYTGLDVGNVGSFAISDTQLNFTITAVPEPTSMVLVGLVGVAGVAIRARRRFAKKA